MQTQAIKHTSNLLVDHVLPLTPIIFICAETAAFHILELMGETYS